MIFERGLGVNHTKENNLLWSISLTSICSTEKKAT